MNILVLRYCRETLHYALFAGGMAEPAAAGDCDDSGGTAVQDVLEEVAGDAALSDARLDAVALHSPFGGAAFTEPTIITDDSIATLRDLVPQAPLHLPPLLEQIEECRGLLPDVPLVAAFGTAFFAGLPLRERLYALDVETANQPGLRRYGYLGLFHEVACRLVARSRRRSGLTTPARILSICLEPQPEVAAAVGRRPVMVTGGATPLEGIPGEMSCGELDPTIVLTLSDKMEWGPEQINTVLTRQSGVLGLSGRRASLADVILSRDEDLERARQLIEYRILQACGAGIAALGGVDAIVFSGRYVEAGQDLSHRLLSRLPLKGQNAPEVLCCRTSLESAIADGAAAALLASRGPLNVPVTFTVTFTIRK